MGHRLTVIADMNEARAIGGKVDCLEVKLRIDVIERRLDPVGERNDIFTWISVFIHGLIEVSRRFMNDVIIIVEDEKFFVRFTDVEYSDQSPVAKVFDPRSPISFSLTF